MTARPSIARRVVISPAAVVVLLIGLWAILGTWKDAAAARAAASERTSHDRSGREDARVSGQHHDSGERGRQMDSQCGQHRAGHRIRIHVERSRPPRYELRRRRVRLGRASAVERRTRCAVLAGRRQHIGRFVRRCSGMVAIQTSASRCRPDSRKSASAPQFQVRLIAIERFTTSMSGKGE